MALPLLIPPRSKGVNGLGASHPHRGCLVASWRRFRNAGGSGGGFDTRFAALHHELNAALYFANVFKIIFQDMLIAGSELAAQASDFLG